MRYLKILLLIILIPFNTFGFQPNDTITISKAELEEMIKLTVAQAIQNADKKSINWYGLGAGLVGLIALLVGYWRLHLQAERRAKEEVDREVQKKMIEIDKKINLISQQALLTVERSTPTVVQKEFNNHEMTRAFAKEKAIKERAFAIISKEGGDSKLNKFLERFGFNNFINRKPSKIDTIDKDNVKLIVFNNINNDLSSEEIVKVIDSMGSNVPFFYYGEKWLDKERPMIGFSNKLNTLPRGLYEGLI